jgi:hypothetical protein
MSVLKFACEIETPRSQTRRSERWNVLVLR